MAGGDPKANLEGDRSKIGSDILADWIVPIVAFVFVLGIFLALVGAILAPVE